MGANDLLALLAASIWLLVESVAMANDVVITKLCNHIQLISDHAVDATDMERRLACGDDKNPPWSDVPANQAKLFLSSFLQGRGYYHPRFTSVGLHLEVQLGEVTLVHEISTQGAPQSLMISRYWQPPGQPLKPSLLDNLEDWVRSELKATGYPCPTVSSRANTDTGDITLLIATGPKQLITAIEAEDVPGVNLSAMRRNDAFHLGDEFNNNWLGLTANRLTAKDLLLSTHFLARCSVDGATVIQKAIPGLPRQATAGVGYNTERGPLLRATLQNSRLDSNASSYTLNLQLSQRLQNFTAKSEWYLRRTPGRFHLAPLLQVQRNDENSYEAQSGKIRVAPASTYDSSVYGLAFTYGPAIEQVRTRRGDGPAYSHIVALEGEVRFMTHDFEYFHPTPRSGYAFGLASTSATTALGSDADFQRLAIDGQALLNIRDLAPPLLVLGVRGSAASTIIGAGPAHLAALPPTYRHFLGSAANLRGFARGALPTRGQGALTAAYLGMEARLAAGLPAGLQPLIFYDMGKTGRASLQMDRPLYYAPGIGLRWQSPLGSLRLTAARGMVAKASTEERRGLERWVFYFSFGEEF